MIIQKQCLSKGETDQKYEKTGNDRDIALLFFPLLYNFVGRCEIYGPEPRRNKIEMNGP